MSLFPASLFATTTISDYVVYGLNGVKVGGASVVNGLVGAQNGYPTSPFDRAIFLNAGATINGDVRSGSNVVLSSSAINGTLYLDVGKTITLMGGSTITATNIGNPDLPVFPSATSFSVGTVNITSAGALAPGSYSNVTVSSGNLTLSAGTYYINALTLSGTSSVTLNTSGGAINVFMAHDASLDGRDATVIGANAINWEIHGDWTQGGGSMGWAGTLFVPFGTATIGSGSGNADFTGHVWANTVDIQHGVTIPEPTTWVLTALGLASVAFTRRTARRSASV